MFSDLLSTCSCYQSKKKAHVISREGYGAKLNRAGSHMTFFVQHET
jgi:hypothetical protein